MKRKAQSQRSRLRRIFGWALRLCVLAVVVGVAGLAGALWYYGRDLPRLIRVEDYRPKRASVVLSRDGRILARFGIDRRTVVPFERIPKALVQAVIAAEDGDFYRHKGLDYPGMLRALLSVLRNRRITQGGSTITQQLIKTLMLTPERTISRKIKEVILARQLESNLTKDEILYLYLNQIYLGHGTYGVQEASRLYFGHGVEEVSLGEAALLAGLIQSPERLSPLRHPEAARSRRSYVLQELVKCGYVAPAVAERRGRAERGARRHRDPEVGLAPHFVEAVRLRVREVVGSTLLYEGGLRIETTLHPDMQRAANASVIDGLDALDRRQRVAKSDKPSAKRVKRALKRALRRRGGKPPRSGQVVEGLVEGADTHRQLYVVDLGGGVRGALPFDSLQRYLDPRKAGRRKRGRARQAPLKPADLLAAGALVRVRVLGKTEGGEGSLLLSPALGPEAALVALEPDSREVLALVGGDPRSERSYDRALLAGRQPGSAFKPLVYATGLALRSPRLTPATLFDDTPLPLPGAGGKAWQPRNYDHKFRGRIRVREALTKSVNVVAVRILQRVGVDRVIDTARSLGVESDLAPYPSLALGASVVRPVEMANAYAAFAAGGRGGRPVLVRRVVDPDGRVVAYDDARIHPALDPDVACLMTDLLGSVVRSGTGRRARIRGRAAVGKTGTTNRNVDAWFVGYVPSLVAAVWVGHDDNRSLGRKETGGRAAAPIWRSFVEVALSERPAEAFPECPGLVERDIDAESGLLAPPGHPDDRLLAERFIAGTEPREMAALPGELSLDNFLLQQTGSPGAGGDTAPPPGPADGEHVTGRPPEPAPDRPGGDPAGDPLAPPAGDPLAPPAGDPLAPPAGDPLAPPAGDPLAPPAGDPLAPPAGDDMPAGDDRPSRDAAAGGSEPAPEEADPLAPPQGDEGARLPPAPGDTVPAPTGRAA